MDGAPRSATAERWRTTGRRTVPPLAFELCTQPRKRLTFVKSRFPLSRAHRQRFALVPMLPPWFFGILS